MKKLDLDEIKAFSQRILELGFPTPNDNVDGFEETVLLEEAILEALDIPRTPRNLVWLEKILLSNGGEGQMLRLKEKGDQFLGFRPDENLLLRNLPEYLARKHNGDCIWEVICALLRYPSHIYNKHRIQMYLDHQILFDDLALSDHPHFLNQYGKDFFEYENIMNQKMMLAEQEIDSLFEDLNKYLKEDDE